jgi:general secretion pathway protein C
LKTLLYLLYAGLGVLVLFQGAGLVSTAMEKRLQHSPTPAVVTRTEPSPREPLVRETHDLSLFASPLFALPRDGEADSQAGEPEADGSLASRFQLLGTVLQPGGSLALIRQAGRRETEVYRRGDMLERYEITAIERHRVLVTDGTRAYELSMYERAARPGRQAPRQAARQQAPEPPGGRTVRKILSRSEVQTKVFDRVNQILTQIAISPYMVNGRMEGLRLIRVPNDSIVYELGGRSGDILRRVNGHQVDQIDQMYKLWENIKDDSVISVDLERRNQMYTYQFEIRE